MSINAKLRSYGTNNKDLKIEGSLNNTDRIGLTPNLLKDFTGIWSGPYTGMFTGTYYVVFFSDNTMKITTTTNMGVKQTYNTSYNLDGNMFNCSYSTVKLTGKLNNNTITGNWSSNGSNNAGDTFTLTKQ